MTVSEVVPTTPPAAALIAVAPIDTGDAKPLLDMDAMLGLLEVQLALTMPKEPSENVACAVNCCV